MQTTLRIDDRIYRQAKAKASELGQSLTRFFEDAVEERLARLGERPTHRFVLPVSSVSGPPFSDEELRRRIDEADLDDDRSKVSRDGSAR